MRKLNPVVRTGLIWAVAHQLIILCGAASVLVSEDLFLLIGICIGLADAPVLFVSVLLRDAGYLNWNIGGIHVLPAAPLAALLYYANAMTPFFFAGALQWFLVGLFVGWRRSRREPSQQPR